MPVQRIRNGVVVLLDALGASQFGLDECEDFVRKRDEIMDEASKSYLLDKHHELLKYDLAPTISAIFGDTLLFAWSFDGDKAASQPVALKFLAMWLAHFIWDGVKRQIFYRGAMSTGEILVNPGSNTVIGPAVVDAAAWYEQADWFGVIATPSFGIGIDHFDLIKQSAANNNDSDEYRKYSAACQAFSTDTLQSSILEDYYSPALVRYSVPLKTDQEKEMWVASWPYALLKLHNDSKGKAKVAFLDALASMSKPLPKGAEAKYEKSIKFFDHCTRIRIRECWGQALMALG